MEQYQLLLATILIVGVASYIVASSQTHGPTRAKRLLPPDRPQPVRQRPVPRQPAVSSQQRRPSSPPITPAKPTPRQNIPSTSARAFTGATIRQTAWPAPAQTSAQTARMAEQQAYRALLAKAHGDRALAERMITYEQKRDPHGTRLIWIQSAIARWERDNR